MIWKAGGFLCAVLILIPRIVYSQSQDQLHAWANQYAQQYGVPQDMFNAQIQAESSFNPNVGCNSAGACGIAQFIPGTAAQFGIDPNNAQQSLQAAAQYDSQLYAKDGSWTAAMTAYSGGLTPSNPADYGTVFSDAATADQGGGGNGGDGGNTSIGTSPTAPSMPSSASPLSAPFSWAWQYIMQAAQGTISNMVSQTENLAWGPITAIFALVGIYWGTEYWFGRLDIGEVVWRFFVLALVLGFIYPGNSQYNTYVVGAIEQLPTYFAQQISACGASACSNQVAGPAAVFDSVWQAFWIKIASVWHASPWYDKIFVALLLWFVLADVAMALGSLYFTFLTVNFVLYVLAAAGPVFILLAVFPATAMFFRFWRDLVGAALLFVLMLDVMLGFFVTVLNQLINAVSAGATTPWTDMLPAVLGAVIVFNVMAFANAFLTFQVGRVHGITTRMITGGMAMATARVVSRAAHA